MNIHRPKKKNLNTTKQQKSPINPIDFTKQKQNKLKMDHRFKYKCKAMRILDE